jgi:Fe-S-cluster containining protein
MPKKFICKRCGECCKSTPRLSEKDIKRILATGISLNSFCEEINGIKYMKNANNQCICLGTDEEGMHYCMIYDARPEICRQYPSEDIEDCRPKKTAFDRYLEEKRKDG